MGNININHFSYFPLKGLVDKLTFPKPKAKIFRKRGRVKSQINTKGNKKDIKSVTMHPPSNENTIFPVSVSI